MAVIRDEWAQLPEACSDSSLAQWIEVLYETGFILRFDWPQWIAEADCYSQNPERIANADLDDLRRLMTVYVSRDRFAPGYLHTKIETGIISLILRRLQRLQS